MIENGARFGEPGGLEKGGQPLEGPSRSEESEGSEGRPAEARRANPIGAIGGFGTIGEGRLTVYRGLDTESEQSEESEGSEARPGQPAGAHATIGGTATAFERAI